jgi:hypothetical protein
MYLHELHQKIKVKNTFKVIDLDLQVLVCHHIPYFHCSLGNHQLSTSILSLLRAMLSEVWGHFLKFGAKSGRSCVVALWVFVNYIKELVLSEE